MEADASCTVPPSWEGHKRLALCQGCIPFWYNDHMRTEPIMYSRDRGDGSWDPDDSEWVVFPRKATSSKGH
jgi:hypothetical protein